MPTVPRGAAFVPGDVLFPTCACAEAVVSVMAVTQRSVRRRVFMAGFLLLFLPANSRRASVFHAAAQVRRGFHELQRQLIAG